MKNLFYLLLFVSFGAFSQPGDLFRYTVIDSTTDLNSIKLLKKRKKLELVILLKEIPVQFANFDNTEVLVLGAHKTNSLKDLSNLRYFKNLKELHINYYSEEKIALKKIKLDSLKIIRISDAYNLKNIDALTDLPVLEKLIISNTANITKFPKFHIHNKVKTLVIDYVNQKRVEVYDNYLDNLKYLTKLTSLTLGNMKEIDKIPDFLPKSVSYLEINGWAQQGDKAVEINDLSNIKLYPYLKNLELYHVHITCANQNFLKFSLDNLYLNRVSVKNDISWIFTFDTIVNLKIHDVYDLITIDPQESSTIISSIDIDNLPQLQTLEFLKLKNINKLEIRSVPKLELPDLGILDSIPNIMIANRKCHLYKVDGEWKKKEYY